MLRYLLKRVALLVPTFFFVSLVAFVVLNIAPGGPGASEGDPTEGSRPCQKAADSAFREQFDLDRPILLNTRPWLARDDVRSLIVTAFDVEGTSPTMAARVRAKETLGDLGTAMVPHLVPLLDDADPEVRRLAACTLHGAVPDSRNGRPRVLDEGRARARDRGGRELEDVVGEASNGVRPHAARVRDDPLPRHALRSLLVEPPLARLRAIESGPEPGAPDAPVEGEVLREPRARERAPRVLDRRPARRAVGHSTGDADRRRDDRRALPPVQPPDVLRGYRVPAALHGRRSILRGFPPADGRATTRSRARRSIESPTSRGTWCSPSSPTRRARSRR